MKTKKQFNEDTGIPNQEPIFNLHYIVILIILLGIVVWAIGATASLVIAGFSYLWYKLLKSK